MANVLKIKMLNDDYLNYKNNSIVENNPHKNISNLEIFLENDILKIKWKDCVDENWIRSYLVKTENSIPEDIYNNPIITQYTTKDKYINEPLIDKDIKLNKLYYYRIFSEFNHEAALYSGFKNIFVVYVEEQEENNDNTNVLLEQKRLQVINSLDTINEPIVQTANWDDINTKIKSLNTDIDTKYIECYLSGNLQKLPTILDLSKDKFINSFNFDFSNSQISANNGYHDLNIHYENTNVYSYQLSLEDLNSISSINNITATFLPDTSEMDLLFQNNDDGSENIEFSGDGFNYVGVSGNSEITLFSSSQNKYYIAIHKSDGYANKAYTTILNDKLIIYWEGWNDYGSHSSSPMDKKWYAVIEKTGNVTIYLLSSAYTDNFYIENNQTNTIANFPTISNMTQYYCDFTNNTVTSKGTFSTESSYTVNKYLFFDTATNKYKKYDVPTQSWDALDITSISENDLQSNGSDIPPIDKIKQLTNPIIYMYIPLDFISLKLNYTKSINNLIYNNPITCIDNIKTFLIMATNYTNEKVIFNINGSWQTYLNNTWQIIDPNNYSDTFSNGIPIDQVVNINWNIKEGDILYFAIIYDINSAIIINQCNIEFDFLEEIQTTQLNLNNTGLRTLFLNLLNYNLKQNSNLRLSLGLSKNDKFPIDYLNIKNIPLFLEGEYLQYLFGNLSIPGISFNNYSDNANNIIYDINFNNITINDVYKYINLLYFAPLVEKHQSINFENPLLDPDSIMFVGISAKHQNKYYCAIGGINSSIYMLIIDFDLNSTQLIDIVSFISSNNIKFEDVRSLGFNVINENFIFTIVENNTLHVFYMDLNFSTIVQQKMFDISSIILGQDIIAKTNIIEYNNNMYIYICGTNSAIIIDNNYNMTTNLIQLPKLDKIGDCSLIKTNDPNDLVLLYVYNDANSADQFQAYSITNSIPYLSNDYFWNHKFSDTLSTFNQSLDGDRLYNIYYDKTNKMINCDTVIPYSEISEKYQLPFNISKNILPANLQLKLTIKVNNQVPIDSYIPVNNIPQ